jgi:hypothetical protein
MQPIFGMLLNRSSRASIPSRNEARPTENKEAPLAEDNEAPLAENETTVKGNRFAHLTLDRGISLRWTLRDILAKRTKFLSVADADLRLLVDMGLVEMHDGEPALTSAGMAAIEQAAAPSRGCPAQLPSSARDGKC